VVVNNDRLMSMAGIDYRYDASGNQISQISTGNKQQRSFNGLNQLVQINVNGKLTQYEYDALGRRSAKITELGRTDFIWDNHQLIGECTLGEYTWYIYQPDTFTPVALIKAGQVYYYHLDQLGTPICLTDENAQIVWRSQQDVFGQSIEHVDSEHQIVNPIRFQGQYFDAESGLHYNRFRYYSPQQARFIHQDPIGLVGGVNHYQYAPNHVNWVDPFGLCAKEDGDIDAIDAALGGVDLIVTGIVNSALDIVAGGAGLVTLAFSGGDIDAATHTIASVKNKQIGPLTGAGNEVAQAIAPVVQEYYEDNMIALGEAALDATGSPLLATMAHKSVEIAGTLIGGKAVLNSVKGAKTGLKVSEKVRSVDMPKDLAVDPKGVYGYLPTKDSQFHSSKWPLDWSDADQVAKARMTRLDYHVGLDKKQEFVDTLRRDGISDDDIGKQIVEMRNQDRLSHYKTPEALEVVYQRNLTKYGNKSGPTYESQLSKYGSSAEVINAALRSNNTMDILTGISKPKR
jgi:RHS repeat-associated protein